MRTLPWTFLQDGLKRIGPLCSAIKTMLRRRRLSAATNGPPNIGMRTEIQYSHEAHKCFREVSLAGIM